MAHRSSKSPEPEVPAISLRIREILEREFDGNAKGMATRLEVPYLALIRTLKGSDPSSRLLAALVQSASVDAQWLLTGRSVQARDFGLSGNVHLLPISPQLLPSSSTSELIPPDWPRQPVVSSKEFREAYCYSISAGDEILREKAFSAGDLLVIQCADDAGAGSPLEWNNSWVTFIEEVGARVRLGHLATKLIRNAGEEKPLYRVGPDSMFGESAGLFRPRRGSATRYGKQVDGVTTLYRDHVLGKVLAKLCWRDEFQTIVPIGKPS